MALKAVGIADHQRLDTHSLRRAFCTTAEREGVPADVGRRVTGHRTRAMWEHYQEQAVGDDLRAVVERVHRARKICLPKASQEETATKEEGPANCRAFKSLRGDSNSRPHHYE